MKADDEGERLARILGAEALYIPEAGSPGVLVLAARPTCAAIYEELIHIGQHWRSDWSDLSELIPQLEQETQVRLLRLAERWGWPETDRTRIQRAWASWKERL